MVKAFAVLTPHWPFFVCTDLLQNVAAEIAYKDLTLLLCTLVTARACTHDLQSVSSQRDPEEFYIKLERIGKLA